METLRFHYEEQRKWCAACESYVHYIQNIHDSYCMTCGGGVDLMNTEDFEKLNAAMQRQKGTRPAFGEVERAEIPILESFRSDDSLEA